MRSDEVRRLRSILEDGQRLAENGRHVEARSILLQGYTRARELGIESGQLLWQLAVQCDYAGNPEEALGFILALMRLDPLSGAGLSSMRIIVAKVRDVLSDPERAVDHPSTSASYAQLLEAGEADTRTHLAMVRVHLAAGRTETTVTILEALVALEPGNADVWDVMREVGKQVGRPDLVRRAASALAAGRRTQVLMLGSGDIHAKA